MTHPTPSRKTLNLGILAHVDAGKTSLTERLLFSSGVTDRIGRVDDGNTQTDTLALERQRGITIRSAVVSFRVADTVVNLIDTPGHPDFIAEVERVLGVLDGVVLVVSAVEGVQAQTRVLMRSLRRLRIPTLIFVNKVDRTGAGDHEVVRAITTKLGVDTLSMGTVTHLGTRAVEVQPPSSADDRHQQELLNALADHDDILLERYLAAPAIPYDELRVALVDQTRAGLLHPIFFGSATTGAGTDGLLDAITTMLPTSSGSEDRPFSGTVFKIERGPTGEKIAYVRVFDGVLRVRDRLATASGGESKVNGLDVFHGGPAHTAEAAWPGQIAKVRGLHEARIGDVIGEPRPMAEYAFSPPTLETVVRPYDRAAGARLHVALTQLSEQDPLINSRTDGRNGELSVSLYGEVQKEVIGATLADDYGIAVEFSETTTICIERVISSGAAVELITDETNPFFATVGLRVEPGPLGSGVRFALETYLHGTLPLAFVNAVTETVFETVRQGLYGWELTDCRITMTHSGYYPRQSHAHATFDKSMSSVGADFRGLTPLVLITALQRAGTQVCEPISAFTLELPAERLPVVLPVLARLGGIPGAPTTAAAITSVSGEIPAAQVNRLTQLLPGLTHGEGLLDAVFDRYEPVRGPAPRRPRSGHDPLDRKVYLQYVKR